MSKTNNRMGLLCGALSVLGLLGCQTAEEMGRGTQSATSCGAGCLPQFEKTLVNDEWPLPKEVAGLTFARIEPSNGLVQILNRGALPVNSNRHIELWSSEGYAVVTTGVPGFASIKTELALSTKHDFVVAAIDGAPLLYVEWGEPSELSVRKRLWVGAPLAIPGSEQHIQLADNQYTGMEQAAKHYSLNTSGKAGAVTGRVVDTAGKAVAFARVVMLCDPDLPWVQAPTGGQAGKVGEFSVANADTADMCWIRATAPGFLTTVRPYIAMNAPVDIGDVVMQRHDTNIAGVRVSATRVQFGADVWLDAAKADLDAAGQLYFASIHPRAGVRRSLSPLDNLGRISVHGTNPNNHVTFTESARLRIGSQARPSILGAEDSAIFALGEADDEAAINAAYVDGGTLIVRPDELVLVVDRFSEKLFQDGKDWRIRAEKSSHRKSHDAGECACLSRNADNACSFSGFTGSKTGSAQFTGSGTDEIEAKLGGDSDEVKAKLVNAATATFNWGSTLNMADCTPDATPPALCHDIKAEVDIGYQKIKLILEDHDYMRFGVLEGLWEGNLDGWDVAQGLLPPGVNMLRDAWYEIGEAVLEFPNECSGQSYEYERNFTHCNCQGNDDAWTWQPNGASTPLPPMRCPGAGYLTSTQTVQVADSQCHFASTRGAREGLCKTALAGVTAADACENECIVLGCTGGSRMSTPAPSAESSCTSAGDNVDIECTAAVRCNCVLEEESSTSGTGSGGEGDGKASSGGTTTAEPTKEPGTEKSGK